MSTKHFTFIDLFSGCGGFSLGLRWAGLKEKAAVDFNAEAVSVFQANFPDMKGYILQEDLQNYEPSRLEKLLGKNHVDLIVGGPPCQGFSRVRQSDGANSGDRIVDDERRELYQQFLKFVGHFKPKIFIMENVLGIRSAVGGHFFNKVQSEARELGYRVHGEIIQAWNYGIPQKRERQLIIGTQVGLPLFSCNLYMPSTHDMKSPNKANLVTLWEAIGDLPPIQAGEGDEVANYDLERRKHHIKKYGGRYILDVIKVDEAEKLTAHRARFHNERDLRDFSRLHEGETSAHALARGIKMEFPYNKEAFKDRYTRQHRNSLCSTIVAHLSKDGLMFIHPTQKRSLTPREAARIQSFPDWFQFPVAMTHQFRLIGNAVPPLVGKAVGLGVCKWLELVEHQGQNNAKMEISSEQAEQWLKTLITAANNEKIAKISTNDFKHGWYAIAYFFGHLHPDSARENGHVENSEKCNVNPVLKKIDNRLISPIYERSGWPVFLVKFVNEARRRFDNGTLTPREYYWLDLHASS